LRDWDKKPCPIAILLIGVAVFPDKNYGLFSDNKTSNDKIASAWHLILLALLMIATVNFCDINFQQKTYRLKLT